ncbi:hypothetical protein SAMN05444287_0194 [Octadecabacter temperatus]|uniref:Uncharacterized protein n=1 Tax=Octadecabacter temperatus TaxID=1458307 RepID=A0A0K0Y2H9_9RHOB|nr:hypothetical protein [Octadecabacter temperatus]AKS45106.1 hypothetical protein OSB_05430 [Octadecabacter temperatus]SIN86276.1 hypothetical protein SAMN05444287_0194 [Octadecabacter temperatus]
MRIFNHTKPIVMGGLMGLMMMWMLHSALTGDGTLGAGALIAFVAAHVVFAAVVIGGALFAARLSPRARQFMDRLHRPSLRHIGVMMAAALSVAGLVHLVVHGGIA